MTRDEALAAVREQIRALHNATRCTTTWSDPLGRHRCALVAGHDGEHQRSRYDQEAGR